MVPFVGGITNSLFGDCTGGGDCCIGNADGGCDDSGTAIFVEGCDVGTGIVVGGWDCETGILIDVEGPMVLLGLLLLPSPIVPLAVGFKEGGDVGKFVSGGLVTSISPSVVGVCKPGCCFGGTGLLFCRSWISLLVVLSLVGLGDGWP